MQASDTLIHVRLSKAVQSVINVQHDKYNKYPLLRLHLVFQLQPIFPSHSYFRYSLEEMMVVES